MTREEREAYMATFGADNISGAENEGEDDEDEFDLGIWAPEHEVCSGAHALKEDLGVDRRVVNWLVEVWPEALVRLNNFGFTPVETVLEKTKNIVTKRKVVQVFGLYDDPPTARILLLAQSRFRKLTLGGVKIDSRCLPRRRVKAQGQEKMCTEMKSKHFVCLRCDHAISNPSQN